MKKLLLILLTLGPAVCWSIPGFYGDVKILKQNQKYFVVEQAGYNLLVTKSKLPPDMLQTWNKSVGKTIVSGVPYASVAKQTKLKNVKTPKPANR